MPCKELESTLFPSIVVSWISIRVIAWVRLVRYALAIFSVITYFTIIPWIIS